MTPDDLLIALNLVANKAEGHVGVGVFTTRASNCFFNPPHFDERPVRQRLRKDDLLFSLRLRRRCTSQDSERDSGAKRKHNERGNVNGRHHCTSSTLDYGFITVSRAPLMWAISGPSLGAPPPRG